MKILFVFRDTKMCEQMGMMYLSAMPKKHNHSTDMINKDLEDIDKKWFSINQTYWHIIA